MSIASAPNAVDWLTLGAATLGTLITGGVAIWTVARSDREAFDVHLDWEWFGSGPQAELPFVYISNRSLHAISIVELTWYSGAFKRIAYKNTALFSEGPEDENFPYRVEPGSHLKLYLDDGSARVAYERVSKRAERYGFLRRPSLWLCVKTMRGRRKFVPAEKALPWVERPRWMTGEKTDA